jgi:hypothetical protein
MKDSLRDLMQFLLSNGELIYNATMGAIVLILILCALSAYRKRNKVFVAKVEKEKPLSSFQYFLEASSRGEEATNEDYFKYREEFESQHHNYEDEDMQVEELSQFERLVETYCPKLILGCIVSLVLMALVAAPYLIIENFA